MNMDRVLQPNPHQSTPHSKTLAQTQYPSRHPNVQQPPLSQQAPGPQPPKPARSRKKEQPLLQRAISAQSGSKQQQHTFTHYTPPGHMMVPHAAHRSAPTSYPTAAPQIARRPSGAASYPPPSNYRPAIIPTPKVAGGSLQAAYARRGSVENGNYMTDHKSRQHHPQSRLARNSISREGLRSPALATPPLANLRNGTIAMSSTPGSSSTPGELPLGDPPTIKPRDFAADSMSSEELNTIQQLTKQLAENSYLYNAHIQLINLLHKGLIAHVLPSAQATTPQEPADYPLLADLRQARQAMDSRYPVGEELWKQWIEDECMLARSVEERVAVMELCQKAVQEEVGSARLWRLYGDWMWLLYRVTHEIQFGGYQFNTLENDPVVSRVLETRQWTQDEKIVGKEIFSWNPMLDIWIQGMKAVEWHLDDSHLLWNPYVKILDHDLARNPSPDKVKHVWTLYADRLQKPHATWQDTFQGFSTFVTHNYDESIYEDTMVAAQKQSVKSKQDYELRSEFELRLERASQAGDHEAAGNVMAEYLLWELDQLKRNSNATYATELYVTLLERANIRFPTTAEWWEDHVDFVLETADATSDLLALVHRASRHCPWSGNLWSKHLLAFEMAERDFTELEDIKHRATSAGLLEEIGGMDELIKVYTAWCGFLRRRAFGPKSGEDERDVAEMGIRSVIENVRDIGVRKYGKSFKGDPLFRAERMYIKFLSQSAREDEARDTWNKLVVTHGDMADFWEKYYLWEMTQWPKTSTDYSKPPEYATNALRQAVYRPSLDYPEKIIDLYQYHCSQHESVQQLRQAHTETRQAQKLVTRRREEEAAQAAKAVAQQQAAQQQQPQAPVTSVEQSAGGEKRKREDQPNGELPAKRARSDETNAEHQQQPHGDASSSATSQMKRDRENCTVIVRQLPFDVTDARVRKFFRDCGVILGLQIIQEPRNETATATIEFADKEDVLTAQTKSMKPFEGQSIEIQSGSATTLWVTNYPPEADEGYIRQLFKDCGEVVQVRFPSLKYNTHRRFCYVQFLTSEQAYVASRKDGLDLGKNQKLQAKISDPTLRQERKGAMQEGREVFIGNLHWSATETDVSNAFERYGNIESVRIPRNMAGKSKGSAFVVFSIKEEATAALEHNLKELKGRSLKVEISIPNVGGAKRTATTIVKGASGSPEPSALSAAASNDGDTKMAGDAGSPPDISTAPSGATQETLRDHHSRTLLLRNVPDTVNDAQIQKLASQHGAIRKITLRMDKREAMVEFDDVKDVGKAELALQGYEIGKGVHLEVARIEEKKGGRRGSDTGASGGPPGAIKGKGTGLGAAPVRRPGQPGAAKRGGRGGLGFRRGGSVAASNASEDAHTNGVEHVNGDAAGTAAAKSQDDFRAMLGKKEG